MQGGTFCLYSSHLSVFGSYLAGFVVVVGLLEGHFDAGRTD